jgi:alpha-N-arabinofuranosidase
MIRNLERDVGRQTGGNLYYHGARPYRNESDAVRSATDPKIGVVEEGERVHLHLVLDDAVQQAKTARVTTELLGKAEIPQVQYENSDGSPLKIETDYFGKHRSEARPTAGPFEKPGQGELKLKIW